MEWILGLVGGLGIGSLLTTVVNHFLAKKSEVAQRLYQEKRDAYIGMTRALYDAEVEPGPKNEKMFGYYLNIAKIFSPKEVIAAAHATIESAPGSKERIKALEAFYDSMKKDIRQNS